MGSQPGDGTPSFGALLKRYRVDRGLSQEALAARAGLSEDAIGMLERGLRRHPRPATISLLAKALGLGPDEHAALLAAARRTTAPQSDLTSTRPAVAAAAAVQAPPRRRPGQRRAAVLVTGILLVALVGAGAGRWLTSLPAAAPGSRAGVDSRAPAERTAGPTIQQATLTVKWGPQHYVSVMPNLTGLVPNSTYPLGLFDAPCGASATNLIDGFPGIDTDTLGSATKASYSREPLNLGVPAGTSLRLGPPVAPDTDYSNNAAAGLLCADVRQSIHSVGVPVTLTVRIAGRS